MTDLTRGHEGKQILKFAIPMLLGNVFQQMYNIVDSLIVGNFLGKDALAAVGASFPIIFTLISLVIGVAIGFTIIISQYFGARDYEKVKLAIDTMYIFIFVASLVISLLGILFSEEIFRLLKLPEELIPEARTYLNIYLSGMVMFFGFSGTSAILRGLGDSKTPLYFLIIASLFNIVFDLLFVLVFKWGIAGVAFATVIAQGGAFITGILWLNKNHGLISFSFFKLRFDREIFLKSLKIGIPSGLQNTFVALGMMALMGIVNTFGTNVIAAYSVGQRIESFSSLFAMNFGMALSTFVGQNIGANKTERVKKGFSQTLIMANGITLIISAAVIIFGNELMGFFTSDPAVIEIGSRYLRIVSLFYLVFTSMFVVGGVMRGAGDTLVPMFITLFSLWVVRIPLALLLSRQMGETGIWWSIPIGWFSGLFLFYIYYLTGRWKTKAVVKYHPLKSLEAEAEPETNPPTR
jgi:putative MATE family efflux protein